MFLSFIMQLDMHLLYHNSSTTCDIYQFLFLILFCNITITISFVFLFWLEAKLPILDGSSTIAEFIDWMGCRCGKIVGVVSCAVLRG